MKKITFSIIAIFLVINLFAQDKIYKKNGPVINAKVIEIAPDVIKYKLTDSPDGPVYVVEKSSLKSITFADGRVEKYEISYKDPANYEGQLTKAIKVNFLAPLLGYTEIGFEKSVTPLKGYEVNLGIIGAGKNLGIDYYYVNGQNKPYRRNAFGFFGDYGYKFKKLPNFFSRGVRMSHVMQGNYVKPTVTAGFYTDHALNYKNNEPTIEKRNNVFGGITLNFGKQWVFGEKFLVDGFWGFGYAFDNHKDVENYFDDMRNHFAIEGAAGSGFGMTFGLKVGLLIK
jgi:hypothetical protein